MLNLMSRNMRLCMIIILASLGVACSDGQKPSSKQELGVKQESFIKTPNWGPKSTQAGKPFMVQSNGDSVIGFELSGPGDANTLQVWFGDQKLAGVAIAPGVSGSATVPPKLFSAAKSVPVYLIYTPTGAKIELGTFEILP
jgi:hypothetical protein